MKILGKSPKKFLHGFFQEITLGYWMNGKKYLDFGMLFAGLLTRGIPLVCSS